MHPQSLSTLTEERREDDDGVTNIPLSSTEQQRQKNSSRLSLASWFGFSGVNGNGREDRSWRPLGSRAARGEEDTGAIHSGGGRPVHLSHRHIPPTSSSSSFSSSRTSVSTAPPGLLGGGGGGKIPEGRALRVHSFTASSSTATTREERNSRSQQLAEQRGAAAAAAAQQAAAAAASKKNRGVMRFSGRFTAILGGASRLRSQPLQSQKRIDKQRGASEEGGSMPRRNGSGDSSSSARGETGRLLLNEEEEEVEMRERSDSDMDDKHHDCPLCFNSCPEWAFTRLIGCTEHTCCCHCLLKYVELEVRENRVEVTCFECSAILHPIDVHKALKYSADEHIIARYEEFSVRKCLLSEPDTRWCPAPDCGYALIAASCAACPQLRCARDSCGTLFCYHCKDIWHDSMTCEEARRTRGIFAMSSGASGESRRGILRGSMGMRRGSSRMSSEAMLLKPGDVKSCPRCRALIVKMDDGSCNHMVCAMCSTEFCWLCLKEISDLHYLSPTGCTFWGKKPWTRKKKLAWQLGTLIGAPLGIALIAGLSVPGIIFGVPVLVGRKVHTRFMHHTKLKRRLITAACVAGSLVVSPVLAVMAVGVGVPIMLAYVYGVVPLSLCRNGGCGWSSALMGEEQSEEVLWTGMGSEMEDGAAAAARGGASGSGLAASSSGDVADGSSAALGGVSMASGGGGAERRGADAGSLAPATSLHSGFSVWTARGKSCGGDSESCSNTAKRQRRPSSESGGVTSLNYEEASTKGMAGSQYHYDDKSVHTLGSQAPELLSCCDDVASTKALAGSVHDTKSLSGSAVVHDVCDEPSTSASCYGSSSHHHHHHPHHRSVSSTRQCKSHSLSGCGRGSAATAASAAGGDHREGGTLSEDDDEIVHDLTYNAATPTGPCSSSSHPAPFTMATPTMTPHLSVFAMHAAAAAAATAAASSAAAAQAASSGSSASTSNPDPFGIRTLLDNMKQMVAADDADCDADDVYRPEPQPSRPISKEPTASASVSPASRDVELGGGARPAPPTRQTSSTSTRGSSTSSSAAAAATAAGAADSTPTPTRRSVRWLPSFLTKKSKQ